MRQTCSNGIIGPCEMISIQEYYKIVEVKSASARDKANALIKLLDVKTNELIHNIQKLRTKETKKINKQLDEIFNQIEHRPKQFDLNSISWKASLQPGSIDVKIPNKTKPGIFKRFWDWFCYLFGVVFTIWFVLLAIGMIASLGNYLGLQNFFILLFCLLIISAIFCDDVDTDVDFDFRSLTGSVKWVGSVHCILVSLPC